MASTRASFRLSHALLACVCLAATAGILQLFLGVFRFVACPAIGIETNLSPWSKKSTFCQGSLLSTQLGGPLAKGLVGASPAPLRVYMYDLPPRFNLDIVAAYWRQRGKAKDATAESEDHLYPNHQHSAEWYLYLSLKGGPSAPGRSNPAAVCVEEPSEADIFFVPFFSSLSSKVDPMNAKRMTGSREHSDEETSRALVEWLRGQATWQRSGGRDHVFPAQHPNSLRKAMHDVRLSVLLLSDFAKPAPLDASLAKDAVLPYVARVKAIGDGEEGERPTLLFFIGVKKRRKGGKIREQLFRVLEGEGGVVMMEGQQGPSGYRAAQEGMRASKYCLHPEGDTPSGGRLFDAIVSGCVPVIISDLIELPFEGLLDYSQFSIFVPSQEAIKPGGIVRMLREISPARLAAMQKRLAAVKHHFIYDAADGAVNMIWKTVAGKVPWIKTQIARAQRITPGGFKTCHCQCMSEDQDFLCSDNQLGTGTSPQGQESTS